jgi:spoIIIJ-associated protein
VIGVEEQARQIEQFLVGLLEAFGLEGEVSTRVEDEVIYADVTGEQTEALVGTKGAILQSVLELCRTIVQRKTQQGARIRLDIAGYSERRREALRIYARRLADKVVAEGGEIMLEPMNSADRKVVHDTVAEIEGVRSFSEGEEPQRSVIVAAEGDSERPPD